MPQSIPYRLSQAVVAALRAHFEPLGAAVRDNPTSRAALNEGARVVFVEDDGNGGDTPGNGGNGGVPFPGVTSTNTSSTATSSSTGTSTLPCW
mgnify:CR=1 FL=1